MFSTTLAIPIIQILYGIVVEIIQCIHRSKDSSLAKQIIIGCMMLKNVCMNINMSSQFQVLIGARRFYFLCLSSGFGVDMVTWFICQKNWYLHYGEWEGKTNKTATEYTGIFTQHLQFSTKSILFFILIIVQRESLLQT